MAKRVLDVPILMPGIRLDRDHEGEAALALSRAEQPWVAGFCLFGGHAEAVAMLTDALRKRAGRPLRIASDMERGAGQQVEGLADAPDLGVLGLAADPRQVELLAHATARDARSVGIDVVFAPVLDVRSEPSNPIVGTRSFGWDPERIADLGAAYVRGLHAGGALAVPKHFPGHGATREDSHDALPVVHDDEALVTQRDLAPFQAVLAAGCRAVMTSHISVPALDNSGRAATFSRPILDRLRAWPGGDRTLVFTDALLMAGALAGGSETEAARQALEAGCDALLYPEDPEAVAAQLLDVSAKREALLDGAIHRAAARWEILPNLSTEGVDDHEAFSTALHVARAALRMSGVRTPPAIEELLLVDDDGQSGCGAILAAAADGRGLSWTRFTPDDDHQPPAPPTVPSVVVVFARARAWKGHAGISEGGRAAARLWQAAGAQVIWCAPVRGGPGPLVPGGGSAIETALSEVLFASPA